MVALAAVVIIAVVIATRILISKEAARSEEYDQVSEGNVNINIDIDKSA